MRRSFLRLIVIASVTLGFGAYAAHRQYQSILQKEGIADLVRDRNDGPIQPPAPPENPELTAWLKEHPKEAMNLMGIFHGYAEMVMHNEEGMRWKCLAEVDASLRLTASRMGIDIPQVIDAELSELKSTAKIEVPDCVRWRDKFRGLTAICKKATEA